MNNNFKQSTSDFQCSIITYMIRLSENVFFSLLSKTLIQFTFPKKCPQINVPYLSTCKDSEKNFSPWENHNGIKFLSSTDTCMKMRLKLLALIVAVGSWSDQTDGWNMTIWNNLHCVAFDMSLLASAKVILPADKITLLTLHKLTLHAIWLVNIATR